MLLESSKAQKEILNKTKRRLRSASKTKGSCYMSLLHHLKRDLTCIAKSLSEYDYAAVHQTGLSNSSLAKLSKSFARSDQLIAEIGTLNGDQPPIVVKQSRSYFHESDSLCQAKSCPSWPRSLRKPVHLLIDPPCSIPTPPDTSTNRGNNKWSLARGYLPQKHELTSELLCQSQALQAAVVSLELSRANRRPEGQHMESAEGNGWSVDKALSSDGQGREGTIVICW